MKNILCRLAIFTFFTATTTRGAGIAVFKDQPFHADASAKPVAYKSIAITNAPLVKLDTGTRQLTLEKSKFVAKVDVPDETPLNIVKESDLTNFRNFYAEMEAFTTRFPQTSQMLIKQSDAIKSNIKKFESGHVRINGNWITRGAYDEIKKQELANVEDILKQEMSKMDSRSKTKAEEKAFDASQRQKGLEKIGDEWLSKEDAMKLHQRNQEILAANKLISSKSIGSADYSIFQVLDDGLLIRVHRGSIKQGGVNTDLVILYGVAKGTAGEGDYYKSDLYWCGNYTYIASTGVSATVNAYCLDKTEAIERVGATLRGEAENSHEDGGEVTSRPNSGPSEIPAPLVGASSSGSGFFVGKAGYFVTNAHVVERGKEFNVFYSGRSLKAELIKVSKVADLALLKVSESVTGMEIAETDAELGEDVFAVGFPNPTIQGMEVKVTKGVISSSKGFQDDETRYQIDAAVQPGNSGGPLCDKSGRLVGVVVSGLNQIAVAKETGSIPQNVNYAIKASEVNALLRQGGISIEGAVKPQGVKSVVEATGLVIVR
jgi:hypothetical protein